MAKNKRVLTEREEFEIMKLVLDKFLWIGTVLLGLGLYDIVVKQVITGAWLIVAGAVVMLAFSWLIIKEFELLR